MHGFRGLCFLIGTALWLGLAGLAAAHDIPNDVTVQAYLKPENTRLNFLVRVPLKAMRDLDFPSTPQGYLDLNKMDNLMRDGATLWISNVIDLYEGESRLPKPRIVAARISLPSDRSFVSWEQSLAHVTGPPLPADSTLLWNQVMMDVLFEYTIHSDHSAFSIDPGGLARLGLRVVTSLRYVLPDGAVRPFEYAGDPGFVHLDPRWGQAALRFIGLGFRHILDGTDHLLFLFCLVIPFRRFRGLIPVVTAFTVAHSITLIASAYDLAPDVLWFPPLIETLIATSIVYMALENIVGGATIKRRWMVAFGFGLVHGFGFSFALRETLQFAGSHLLTSLLSFNVGVELGQLLVLALLVPALEVAFRFVVAERMGTIILSALVAHTGWHWMMERWEVLKKFNFELPPLNAALLATIAGWLIIAVDTAGLVWLARVVWAYRAKRSGAGDPQSAFGIER